MSDKEQLIISALQERIGQMAASYETQIAILRAELTHVVKENSEKQVAMAKYSEELSSSLEG